jgi:CubicO group peptidase (beta-lactamase class C family)
MTDLRPSTTRTLRRILIERQSKHRVPGMVGAVLRDGDLLWADGIGVADLDRPGVPPDADSTFAIASITKTFTATVVMALRDEGRLSLDDSVDEHIPESKHSAVTVRQMLAHTTGMQREPVGDIWDSLEPPDRDELVRGWNEAERVLRPHDRWHYSNLCYAMLGELVTRLDGRDWAESVQARILDPLEMRSTTVGLTGPHVRGYYVPPFHDVPVPEPEPDWRAMNPAGSLASTANDLTRWAAFLADPVEEVLDPATVEEMCQPQIVADTREWQLAWGLGLELVRRGSRVYVGHEGGNPGHITAVFVERESKTGGIALMNSTSAPAPADVAVDLAEHVIEHDPAEPEIWAPGTEVPDEFVGVLGRWFSEGAAFSFTVEKGRLQAISEGAPSRRKPSVFVKVDDDVYRTESEREMGELLRITRDQHGAVTRMHWATYVLTREPLAFGEHLDRS